MLVAIFVAYNIIHAKKILFSDLARAWKARTKCDDRDNLTLTIQLVNKDNSRSLLLRERESIANQLRTITNEHLSDEKGLLESGSQCTINRGDERRFSKNIILSIELKNQHICARMHVHVCVRARLIFLCYVCVRGTARACASACVVYNTHLHQLRASELKEARVGLRCASTRHQSLSGAGRAIHQHSLWRFDANRLETILMKRNLKKY